MFSHPTSITSGCSHLKDGFQTAGILLLPEFSYSSYWVTPEGGLHFLMTVTSLFSHKTGNTPFHKIQSLLLKGACKNSLIPSLSTEAAVWKGHRSYIEIHWIIWAYTQELGVCWNLCVCDSLLPSWPCTGKHDFWLSLCNLLSPFTLPAIHLWTWHWTWHW